jgi:GT2 family glycosyltransferase
LAAVDVIIPNWNGKEWLGACLDSLLAQIFTDFEIIIVDNGSNDNSIEFIHQNYSQVRLIALPENTGFSGAINRGTEASNSPYICWFNNDAIAEPDFLFNLLSSLKAKETEGFKLAAAKVTFLNQPTIIDSAGMFVRADGIGRGRGYKQVDKTLYNVESEIFGVGGVAALFNRKLFDEIGSLDEDFFLYSEDLDLNYRAQLAGHRCLYVPSAKARHVVSGSSRKIEAKAVRYANRNAVLAIIKNIPLTLLILHFPAIITGQIYQIVLYARRNQLKAALLGKLDVIKVLPVMLAKRKIIQKNRKISLSQFSHQMRLGRNQPRFWQKFKKGLFKWQ